MTIDLARLLHGDEILSSHGRDGLFRYLQTFFESGTWSVPTYRLHCFVKSARSLSSILPDEVRDIQSKIIAWLDEQVNSFETNMISIDIIRPLPSQFRDGLVRLFSRARRVGPDKHVLAIRFVPDRNNFDAELPRLDEGGELGNTLDARSDLDPDRIFSIFISVTPDSLRQFLLPQPIAARRSLLPAVFVLVGLQSAMLIDR